MIPSYFNIPTVTTALVTPFTKTDTSLRELGLTSSIGIDEKVLKKLILFQLDQGITGILKMGTTGETSTVSREEHIWSIKKTKSIADEAGKKIFLLSGCGSNSTQEALYYTTEVYNVSDAILLVDCYYNGPSSMELRKEYYEIIAKKFPMTPIIVYVIPGRTGCLLHPVDLYKLAMKNSNVVGVKYAEANIENSLLIRELLPDFHILSGDDNKTFAMIKERKLIRASGVISVISNIAPAPIKKLCDLTMAGNYDEAFKVNMALSPLFDLVTVKYERQETVLNSEKIFFSDKIRNPVPIKVMMNILGMTPGQCRSPLGKLPKIAALHMQKKLLTLCKDNWWVLEPIQKFFNVDVKQRIEDWNTWKPFVYADEG